MSAGSVHAAAHSSAKSPDKPGTGWILASVTHMWSGVAKGISWAVVHGVPPHRWPRYPLTGCPGSAEAWGKATVGKGNAFHRGS